MTGRRRTRARTATSLRGAWRLNLCLVVAVALVAAAIARTGVDWLLAFLGSINVVTLGVYGWDKWSARRQWRRVPEVTLHVLSFAGGSPAALFAQQAFRHKTRKQSFQVIFWVLVVLQTAVILWLVWGRSPSPGA